MYLINQQGAQICELHDLELLPAEYGDGRWEIWHDGNIMARYKLHEQAADEMKSLAIAIRSGQRIYQLGEDVIK